MRRNAALVGLLVSLAIIAAACGGGNKTSNTQTAQQKQGGDLVVGAEQELDCADWISSCATAAWGIWALQAHTIPRAYDFTTDNQYKFSNLLAEEPKFEAGPPQKVTYKLNPSAVWSDGQPITSADFNYTWQQTVTGTDINDKTGYQDIASIDTADPRTVVVTFQKPYAGWKDLFGGYSGLLPKHLLEGKDRNAEMKDGYKWSGGPWMLDHWTKGQEIKLVPNPKYWGTKPKLNSVTFKFVGGGDTAAELQAYKTGQVSAIYPQAQPGLQDAKNFPDTKFSTANSLFFEAIWFNTEKFPLNDQKVRQALAYSTDREAIVKQLFQPIQSDIKPIQSFFTPAFGRWYSDSAFSMYKPDKQKVNDLMTQAGFQKGADGIWAKGGQKADIELKTTSGNKRRELTSQILQSQWKDAGFNLTLAPEKAGTLFGQTLPGGNFTAALFAQTPPSTDPKQCVNWCSENIPTPANKSGQNYTRLPDAQLDQYWKEVDTVANDSQRADAVKKAEDRLAQLVPGIPVDPFPDIIVANTAKINGPINHNVVFGPFVYMNEWSLK